MGVDNTYTKGFRLIKNAELRSRESRGTYSRLAAVDSGQEERRNTTCYKTGAD